MGFRRGLTAIPRRPDPVSTELRLRTVLLDIEAAARDTLDGIGRSCALTLEEIERMAKQGRDVR